MKLRFLNHSCFTLEQGDVRLMVDPWIEGRVFNDGWDLLTKTPFSFDDFKTITHIWFSHEHPDHFSPPNLNKIVPEVRKRITVLFQETVDKRVVRFCEKLGFKDVIELKPDTWLSIGEDLNVLCEPYQEGDSWVAFKSNEHTILNTNDCGLWDRGQALKIKEKVGKVDVLLTQFSYAFWAGNKDQKALRASMADEKLQGYKFQCDIFQPRYTIPIASYIWFCHEENHYLNDGVNRPQKVYDFLRQSTEAIPILLYPGDVYSPGDDHDSAGSIEKFNADYQTVLSNPELVKGSKVVESQLLEAAGIFVQKLRKNYSPYVNFLRPSKIFLTDYGTAFELTINGGLEAKGYQREACDIALSSESLAFCFKFAWGNDTLGINGRYERPAGGTYSNFYNFFRFDQLKSRGIQPGFRYFSGMVARKVLVMAGLQKSG
ncbi:MAG: MBL fold metallo-hydrolase [Vicinamibacteria bacterium]